MKTEAERRWFAPWINASLRYSEAWDGHYLTEIQDLASLEIELRRRDAFHWHAMQEGNLDALLSMEVRNMPALSAAWVMMAYEIIRTLCQKHRANCPGFAEDAAHSLKRGLQTLSRIRIPLAKHEAGRRSKDTWPHAFHGFQEGAGVGWAIGPDEFVTRSQLADAFIESLTSALPPDQQNWDIFN